MQMISNEVERVEKSANWYISQQLKFDRQLVEYRYRTMKPYLPDGYGLELGSGDGSMTKYLRKSFKRLTVVDGAQELIDHISEGEDIEKVCCLFEDFKPKHSYDAIIMEHILEHIDNPVELLQRSKEWLAPNGIVVIGVPNALSLHRRVATKMGLLKNPYELNERDHKVGHRRVYDSTILEEHVHSAGLQISQKKGVFVKPVSNQQIEETWTEEMKEGFFQLGEDFPDLSAEISFICRL